MNERASRIDLGWLWEVLLERRSAGDVEASYTARLLAAGRERCAQKVGEEATETIIAGLREAQEGGHQKLVEEAADLVYHLFVFLLACDVSPSQVAEELEHRHRET